MRRISLVLIWLVVLTAAYPVAAQSTDGLTQAQAVEIAERFVFKNGYSDESRPNAISSRALIALIKTVNGRSFWSVQFLFRKQALERKYDFGREVRVSLDGSRVWMGPKTIAIRIHSIP
jgi:hypothetical protein